ncbi:ABC transporter permease [Amycolatopsis sp. cg5]|uniref:ABC transporter permease n=1 Tax=Amycolatopsis sp. cg5 TaxID=3238802 RepID=UPI0035242AFA
MLPFESACGVALAIGLGRLVPLAGLTAPATPVLPALVVVVGATALTTLAVLAPALSAARVSPLEALRTSATVDARGRIGVGRLLLGLGLLGGALTLLFTVASAGLASDRRGSAQIAELLRQTVFSGALAFCALIALGPVVVTPLLKLAAKLLRRSTVGRLAVAGVGGAPRRAASITSVVALGVGLVIATITGAQTLAGLGKAELASAYPADLRITGDVDVNLLRHNGLRDVQPYRRIEGVNVGGKLTMSATDLDLRGLAGIADFRVEAGSLDAMGPGRLILASKMAARLGLTAGSVVDVNGRERTVAAVVHGELPLGSLILDRSDVDGPVTGVLANGDRSGVPAGVDFVVLADKRAAKMDQFTTLAAIAIGLVCLTVLISVVGVGSTTALSVLERRREIGLLRAVGLSRARLRVMIATEAGVYGALGALLGLALGLPYAWLAIVSLGIGWPMQVPLLAVLTVVLALGALTAGSGLFSARAAAKVSPATACADNAS